MHKQIVLAVSRSYTANEQQRCPPSHQSSIIHHPHPSSIIYQTSVQDEITGQGRAASGVRRVLGAYVCIQRESRRVPDSAKSEKEQPLIALPCLAQIPYSYSYVPGIHIISYWYVLHASVTCKITHPLPRTNFQADALDNGENAKNAEWFVNVESSRRDLSKFIIFVACCLGPSCYGGNPLGISSQEGGGYFECYGIPICL